MFRKLILIPDYKNNNMNKSKLLKIFLFIFFFFIAIKYFIGTPDEEISKEKNLVLSIDKAVEDCLKAFDIQDNWINRKVIKINNDINKKILIVRIPKDLAFSVFNLALTRAVTDSGGLIIEGKELTTSKGLILTAGYDNIVIDSLILKKDAKLTHKKGKIAIIIDDFGSDNGEIVEKYLNLLDKITFSVIPGNKYSKEIGESASKNEKEVIIHLPMESHEPLENEEKILLKDKMNRKNVENIIKISSQELPMAKGLSSHMGSKATEDAVLMKILADELRRKKMYFIDSFTTENSKAFEVCKKSRVKVLKRDIFIDHEENNEFILSQLKKLMETARNNGKAIGIGHVTKEITFEILSKEMPKIQNKGYEFVFVSELLE